ncbi:MAG: hypothetical protein AABW41_05700 [Nanoarchaeota archaeon]
MKKLVLIPIFLLIFIASCGQQNTEFQPSSKITDVYSNDLKAEMYMYPGPNFIKPESSITLKFVLTSFYNKALHGRISVEDTPDNSQFSGIQEPAEEDFSLPASEKGKNSIKEIIIPGATEFMYANNLDVTGFTATITYSIEKELVSDKICIKYSPRDVINNCNIGGSTSFSNALISNIRYEYADTDTDNIVDKMDLSFDMNEKCEITTSNDDLIQDSQVYLKDANIFFECAIDSKNSNQNHKAIKCTNTDSLNPSNPYYQDFIVAKFKYDCQLLLKSGFISLNKEDKK